MEKRLAISSESPHIILEIDGNLSLKGTDEPEVVASSGSPEDLALDQQDDEVRIRCSADCAVRLPRDARIDVESVSGNVNIKAVDGELRIQNVDGNLDLRSVGPAQIDKLDGNLSAKNVDGDLNIGQVDGNATVRDVTGSFTVSENINGNLLLDDVSEDIVTRSDGNLMVRFDPLPGQKYEFTADGNILCRLPADASAKIMVNQADHVLINVGDVRINEEVSVPYEIVLGDGDSSLVFSSDGNLQITGDAPGWGMGDFDINVDMGREFEGMADEISRQVTEQIEAQVNMIEQQVNAQMESLSAQLGNIGMSPEKAEQIAARAREASARATAHAQERMQRAQERIQHKMEAAQRKAEQKARAAERAAQRGAQREKRSWSFVWPAPPTPPGHPGHPMQPPAPEAAGESASDEERLLILRMLERKQITAEEAEQLLAALEGKGD